MSSILNRLRELEGATNSEPSRTARRRETPQRPCPGGREEGSPKGALKTTVFRVLAGILFVCILLLVLRAWKGESPAGPFASAKVTGRAAAREGKTLARDANRMEATHEKPVESPTPAVVSEGEIPSGSFGSESGDFISPGAAPLAMATSSPVDATGPRKTPLLDSEAASPRELPAEVAAAPPSSSAKAGENLPTPEEDDKTKRILRGLKVTGVYQDAKGYLAFIDGRELQKGDKIGHVEIAEIASERITFTYKGKRYIMRLR